MTEKSDSTLKRGDADYYRQLARASWAKRKAYDWAEHVRKGWAVRKSRRPGTSGWSDRSKRLDAAPEIPH
jgi:hypothetical protein